MTAAADKFHLCTANDIGDLTNTADAPVDSSYPIANMEGDESNKPTVFDLQGAIRLALYGTRSTAANANCYALHNHEIDSADATIRHRQWDNENQGGAVVYDSAVAKSLHDGSSGNYVSSADGSNNSLTGDIQIIARIAADDYTPGTAMAIVAKWDVTSDQRSFILQINTDGTLSLIISNDGTSGTVSTYTSTVAPSITDGSDLWIKATLDVDNGSSDSDATFYTSITDSDDVGDVTWTQLGSVVNSGATESIYNSDSVIEVASTDDGTLVRFDGYIYRVLVYNGINGTIVIDYDPRQQRARDTLFHGSFPGSSGDYISTPNSDALSVTGDMEIIVQVAMDDWTPAAAQTIAAKYSSGGDQRSWLLWIKTDGTLQLFVSNDGTTGTETSYTSSAAPTVSNGQKLWLRITFDSDNGSSNSACVFFTSSNGITWSQLGTEKNSGATEAIFDSTALLELGGYNSGTGSPISGKVYKARIYDGLVANGGTLVANFDANDYQGGSTWTASNTGEVYTIHGNVTVNRYINSSVMAGELPGSSGDYFSSPDSSVASIAGDIDIQVLVAADDFTPASDQTILGKWTESGDQRAYRLVIDTTGVLNLDISTSGAVGTVVSFASTAAPSTTDGAEIWLRVTLDVDNGKSGADAKFYTSTDGETWTQLGTTVTNGSTVSIDDGTAVVEIGANNAGTAQNLAGYVKRARVYSGIAGTLAVDFNVNDYEGGTLWESINTGELWTINGNAQVSGQWALQGNVTISETWEDLHQRTPNGKYTYHYSAWWGVESMKSYRTDIKASSFTNDQISIDKAWVGESHVPEYGPVHGWESTEKNLLEHVMKPGRGMATPDTGEEDRRSMLVSLKGMKNSERRTLRWKLSDAGKDADLLMTMDPNDAKSLKEETSFIGRRMNNQTLIGSFYDGNEEQLAFEEN